jgi:hypothetical protein
MLIGHMGQMPKVAGMCVPDTRNVMSSHRRKWPNNPATHIALPRETIEEFPSIVRFIMEGRFETQDGPLELTPRITPPPGHIWVGHEGENLKAT